MVIDELNEKVAFPDSTTNLQIRPADVTEREYKLFIGMLPKSVDDNALFRRFSIYGPVKEVCWLLILLIILKILSFNIEGSCNPRSGWLIKGMCIH